MKLIELTNVRGREEINVDWIIIDADSIIMIEPSRSQIAHPLAKSFISTTRGSGYYVRETKEEILKKISYLRGE